MSNDNFFLSKDNYSTRETEVEVIKEPALSAEMVERRTKSITSENVISVVVHMIFDH